MPPKRSSKSPKGMAKPRTPVTSSRGSGTSPAADPAEGYVKNIEDEERKASEDDEPQVFFEGSVERDANAFLDRVEDEWSLIGESLFFAFSAQRFC